MGRNTIAKETMRGTCRRLVHGCKYVVPKLIQRDILVSSKAKNQPPSMPPPQFE